MYLTKNQYDYIRDSEYGKFEVASTKSWQCEYAKDKEKLILTKSNSFKFKETREFFEIVINVCAYRRMECLRKILKYWNRIHRNITQNDATFKKKFWNSLIVSWSFIVLISNFQVKIFISSFFFIKNAGKCY